MKERPAVTVHQIDSEALDEISRAHSELVQSLDWFLSRNDLEAVERLMPVVQSIGNRLTAIYEVSYPEIAPCIEAINRFGDEMVQRFIQARSQEERKFLSRYVTEAIAKWKQGSETLLSGRKKPRRKKIWKGTELPGREASL
jgi:hypothetical protein